MMKLGSYVHCTKVSHRSSNLGSKIKRQCHQGQKTKNCWVIPIDNAR